MRNDRDGIYAFLAAQRAAAKGVDIGRFEWRLTLKCCSFARVRDVSHLERRTSGTQK